MTKRTRLFVLMSTGTLIAGLGTGAVASYLGGVQIGVQGGPDELAYVPADSHIVAFADVREVRDSGFQAALREFGASGDAHRLHGDTGIDLERDVDVLVASMSPAEADVPDGRPLLLARGRFDRPRIEDLVERQGGVRQEYRGTPLMEHPRANIGIAFVEPDLVALGNPGAVRRALDVKAGHSPGARSDAELMRQVRDMDGGHAWAVVRGAAVTDLIGTRDGPASGLLPGLPALSGFRWLSARGSLDGTIRGRLRAEAADDATARDLRDAIRGAVALGRLQVGHASDWAELIDSFELGGEGRTVSLGFAIPAGALESMGRLPRRSTRPDARRPDARRPDALPGAAGRPAPQSPRAAPPGVHRPSSPRRPPASRATSGPRVARVTARGGTLISA